MFTGIVREIGVVGQVEKGPDGVRIEIEAGLAAGLREGDSVSVEGVCLTAAELRAGLFQADVMNQTLSVTSLGSLSSGDRVNLEPALAAGEPLGGHIVQGHVDGVGEVIEIADDGFARRLRVRLPDGLERYAVEHGSITLAGVSLTVAGLERDWIEVSLIPETLERTTLGEITAGDPVNVELDVVARYVERLLGFQAKGRS